MHVPTYEAKYLVVSADILFQTNNSQTGLVRLYAVIWRFWSVVVKMIDSKCTLNVIIQIYMYIYDYYMTFLRWLENIKINFR